MMMPISKLFEMKKFILLHFTCHLTLLRTYVQKMTDCIIFLVQHAFRHWDY